MRPGPSGRTVDTLLLVLSASSQIAVTTPVGHLHAQPAEPIAAPPRPAGDVDAPITVLMTRYVRPGCEASFESLVNRTFQESRAIVGQPSAEFLRPGEPNSHAYTLIVRFNRISDYRHWLESPERASWLEGAAKLADGSPQYQLRSGLEVWLTPPDEAGYRRPDFYKTVTVNALALYPAYVVSTLVLSPAVVGFHPLAVAGISTAFSVFVGGYFVMPYIAPLFRDWLYPPVTECQSG